jgi:hypothetical protein
MCHRIFHSERYPVNRDESLIFEISKVWNPETILTVRSQGIVTVDLGDWILEVHGSRFQRRSIGLSSNFAKCEVPMRSKDWPQVTVEGHIRRI